MAYVALVTLLLLVQYFVFTLLVGAARGKSGIQAPAVTGDENFERAYRVQMNTLEQLVLTLPALWLSGMYFDPLVAALLGLAFFLGRVLYRAGYVKDPARRGPGFGIGLLATLGLVGTALWGVIGAPVKVLVTGAAGFIGFHVSQKLLARGDEVVGLDNINDYYDVNLKLARLARLEPQPGFSFARIDLVDRPALEALFREHRFAAVINLAAQAGVRYSLENPQAYIDSNIVGFTNILECCRHHDVGHLVYASSSSVYGMNSAMPFSIHDNVDHPISLYAASKKANELMAHTYSHLFGLPTTGLRFFTVYGPWGRPDMALFLFTRAILAGEPIKVFNNGRMQRDFTYIDDIVEGVVRVMDKTATPNPDWDGARPDPGTSSAPYRLYNIGNNNPVKLTEFIDAIEQALGLPAQRELLPMQPGDVAATYANIDDLVADVDYRPQTPIQVGIDNFVAWYREYMHQAAAK